MLMEVLPSKSPSSPEVLIDHNDFKLSYMLFVLKMDTNFHEVIEIDSADRYWYYDMQVAAALPVG